MVIVVIALAVALIVVIYLYFKQQSEVNEQSKRAQEFRQEAEKAKQQQEFQRKREISEVQRQKDEDRQRIESIYKQQISAILDKEAELQKSLTTLQGEINKLAQAKCQEWIQNQCELIKQDQREIAIREAQALLEQWAFEREQAIRQDAIRRTQAITLGKVTEHFIPYLPGFTFNPKDARFMGMPIDFVVFDGMDEDDVREIVFVEVKTGAATLTKRQRQIRDAINNNRCRWKLINLDEAKQSQQLLPQAAL